MIYKLRGIQTDQFLKNTFRTHGEIELIFPVKTEN